MGPRRRVLASKAKYGESECLYVDRARKRHSDSVIVSGRAVGVRSRGRPKADPTTQTENEPDPFSVDPFSVHDIGDFALARIGCPHKFNYLRPVFPIFFDNFDGFQ